MPFKSRAQQAYLFAKEPEVAKNSPNIRRSQLIKSYQNMSEKKIGLKNIQKSIGDPKMDKKMSKGYSDSNLKPDKKQVIKNMKIWVLRLKKPNCLVKCMCQKNVTMNLILLAKKNRNLCGGCG